MGSDNTHPRIVKEPADVVAKPIFIIFEKSWSPGGVRGDWKKGNITHVIIKKGRKEDLGNYRMVSLVSVSWKITD